jgi:hypothetical protein
MAEKIQRFHVMALLQAARAETLGLTEREAKSWGLNRAIFYAAAKRGWKRAKAVGAKRPVLVEYEESLKHHDPVYVLGGEKAFRARDLSRGLLFKFGGSVQTAADFDEKIKAAFGDWNQAWSEALAIVRSAERRDLDIQSRFFKRIYEPNRDRLSRRWDRAGRSHLKLLPKAA